VSLEISNMMWAVVNFVCWTSQSVAVWDINTVIFFLWFSVCLRFFRWL
jgi:hypothetical protein